MIYILIGLKIFIKSALWLTSFALLTGVIRLFILGIFQKYPNPIRDISVLKKGDIILTGKQSAKSSVPIQISNVLSRKLKHRFWTHAALYRGNGLLWEAQPKGIISRKISDYLNNGYIIRAFRHKYIKDENILDKVLVFCAKQEGRPYGFLGLLFFTISSFTPISFNFVFTNPLIDRVCRMDRAYFCSELIVDAFYEVGHPISPYDGWRVKPTDFISNPLLEPVEPKNRL